MRRLLAGAALTVDRRAGHVLRPAGREHGVASHVHRLLPDLHHAAEYDVVDGAGIDPGPVLERREHFGREIDRMPVLQLAIAFPDRGSHGIDDDGGGHW